MNYNSVIHIGAGKCGSSSLQSSLSHSPMLIDASNSQCYEYAAIRGDGRLLRGEQLQRGLSATGFGSVDITLDACSDLAISNVAENIQLIHQANRIPILSCEAWASRANQFEAKQLLTRLSLTPKIIIYIRSPLEWINSAWWQWGAWQDISFEDWIERQIKIVDWTRWVREWKALDGVVSIEVRLASSDVVESFGSSLNLELKKNMSINVGSPPALLRFLQRQRKYRKGPHDNLVERHLVGKFSATTERTPWVIPENLQISILQRLQKSYSELLTFLPSEEQQAMRDDARWWCAFSGEKRIVEAPGPIISSNAAMDKKLEKWARSYLLKRALKKSLRVS